MHGAAGAPEQRLVGHLLDEDVPKGVALLAARVHLQQQVAVQQPIEQGTKGLGLEARQLGQEVEAEVTPDGGRKLRHPLGWAQPVQPGQQ